MISDIPLASVGIGGKTLRTKENSFLKRSPIQSSDLTEDQKLSVVTGFELAVVSCKIADNHYVFDTTDSRFLGHGYAFLEHFELIGGEVEVEKVEVKVEVKVSVTQSNVLVTADQFYAIAPQTSLDKLVPLFEPLSFALAKYNINTPLRICHFLAQACHESDQFNTTEEYASGEEYEGYTEIGNIQDGDGVRFKGRSLIQITGRTNYQAFSDYLGVDFVSNSTLLAAPKYAWLGAGWFWDTRNLSDLADQDRFRDITITINGGTNGIEERLANLERAKKVFGI